MDNNSAIAVSRLIAQQRGMAVIANNLANANTPGFKAERVQFADWLSRQPMGAGENTVDYVQDRATWREPQDGTLSHTGNPFDLALAGPGYFTVQTPSGLRLTRAGRFGPLPDGTLGDEAGNPLLDASGQPIRVASTDTQVTVAGDGTISGNAGQIGRIAIVTPNDPAQMQAQGAHLFDPRGATAPAASPKIVQGAIEDSNVQPIAELTRMMTMAREFEFTTQFIQGEADRQQNAIAKILPQQA